jgi:catechol 2,3-dioxygenase-like lactoylglutathione lyase family enzyme
MIQVFDLHTVGVPVTDQQRSLHFYVNELGFETRIDRPIGGGQRWIEVAPPGAAVTIALVPASDDAPAGVETGIRLKTWDADADHALLRSHDVEAGEVLRWPGVPAMFMLRDPDGNRLEIIEQPRAAN